MNYTKEQVKTMLKTQNPMTLVLAEGETAWNPSSSTPVSGPATLTYRSLQGGSVVVLKVEP